MNFKTFLIYTNAFNEAYKFNQTLNFILEVANEMGLGQTPNDPYTLAMDAAKQGNWKPMGAVISQLQQNVSRSLYMKGYDPDLSGDIVNNLFIKIHDVLEKNPEYFSGRNIKATLMTMALNDARNLVKRGNKSKSDSSYNDVGEKVGSKVDDRIYSNELKKDAELNQDKSSTAAYIANFVSNFMFGNAEDPDTWGGNPLHNVLKKEKWSNDNRRKAAVEIENALKDEEPLLYKVAKMAFGDRMSNEDIIAAFKANGENMTAQRLQSIKNEIAIVIGKKLGLEVSGLGDTLKTSTELMDKATEQIPTPTSSRDYKTEFPDESLKNGKPVINRALEKEWIVSPKKINLLRGLPGFREALAIYKIHNPEKALVVEDMLDSKTPTETLKTLHEKFPEFIQRKVAEKVRKGKEGVVGLTDVQGLQSYAMQDLSQMLGEHLSKGQMDWLKDYFVSKLKKYTSDDYK